MGPTCYSQCDLVFFLIRSCLYHYCVYSVIRHYSYISQFFPLAFFILFCRSLLFFSCVEAWCSTRPDTVYFVHILAVITTVTTQNTTFSRLLLSNLFLKCIVPLHVTWLYIEVFLSFSSCINVMHKTNQKLFFFLNFFFLQ